jgi:hypothetical protein
MIAVAKRRKAAAVAKRGKGGLSALIARDMKDRKKRAGDIPASARSAAHKARELAEQLESIAEALDDPDTPKPKQSKLTALVGGVARSFHGVEERQGEWFLLFNLIQQASDITFEKQADPWRLAINVLRANIKTVFPGLWEKLDVRLLRVVLTRWPHGKGKTEGTRTHGVAVDRKLETLRQALTALREDPVYGHLCIEGSHLVKLFERWKKHLRALD